MLRTFFLVLLATTAGSAAALTVTDAYPRYMDEDLFKTVTEFLTGNQREGKREVLRTQADERTGQYFILTLKPSAAAMPADAEIVLEVLPSDARETRTYRFSQTSSLRSTTQLYLGVTGSDWPEREIQPTAWRARIQSGDTVLAEWKSFLWEMP